MKQRKEAQGSWESGQERKCAVHLLCARHCVHLLCAGYCGGLFCRCFLLPDNLRWKGYSIHFTDEETEAQKSPGTGSRSRSLEMAGLGFKLRQANSKASIPPAASDFSPGDPVLSWASLCSSITWVLAFLPRLLGNVGECVFCIQNAAHKKECIHGCS